MLQLIKANKDDAYDSIIAQEIRDEYASRIVQDDSLQWKFSVVPGFFKQSDVATDDIAYDPLTDHFGLALSSWNELEEKLHALNEAADENTKYKLLFCARHGTGYHNEAVELFGREAWDNHYSALEGAVHPATGEYFKWAPDPYLSKAGYAQAEYMHELVEREVNEHSMPIPHRIFVSPFTRSCETLKNTMRGVCMQPDGTGMHPFIVENLRETIGMHLCDKRSSKTVICERQEGWGFEFEEGFAEEDELYKPDWRESVPELAVRANKFLQWLFGDEHNREEIVWNCTHSGQIRAMIIATGHRAWTMPTAGMIPIVVKAEKK